jgi:hypothetical protein
VPGLLHVASPSAKDMFGFPAIYYLLFTNSSKEIGYSLNNTGEIKLDSLFRTFSN